MSDDRRDAVSQVRSNVMAALRESSRGVEAVEVACLACVRLLPVDGASVSVMSGTQHRATLYASDATVSRIETLQFSLGEGPCFEAFNSQRPVLVADLPAASALAWPAFAEEMIDQPVGAIFAFPLQRGAISVGAMDLYRQAPGWLSTAEIARALALVDIVTTALLALDLAGADDGGGADAQPWSELPRDREQVHQATGMLMAAFDVSAEKALARLRGYSFSASRLVDDVARDIVAGRLAPEDLD